MKLIAPVLSFAQLKSKALKDPKYKALALESSWVLGGPKDQQDLNMAFKVIQLCIDEDGEADVLEEINSCRGSAE